MHKIAKGNVEKRKKVEHWKANKCICRWWVQDCDISGRWDAIPSCCSMFDQNTRLLYSNRSESFSQLFKTIREEWALRLQGILTVSDHISSLFLIKFDKIPSFPHNVHDFQIDLLSGFPHFDTILLSGFPCKFCNFDILDEGGHF